MTPNTSRQHQLVDRIANLSTDLAAAKEELLQLLAGNTSSTKSAPSNGTGTHRSTTPTPSSPAPSQSASGKPISERVRSLLEKGPHTFEALYSKIGPQFKKAIRSTVDKKRVAGQFGYDGNQYFIATKKPAAKKPPAKSTKSKKPTKATPATVAPLIIHADPEVTVAETPIVEQPPVSPLMKPTPAVLIRRK